MKYFSISLQTSQQGCHCWSELGSDWSQMEKNMGQNVLKLILKSPKLFPIAADLNQFGAHPAKMY